MFFDQKVLAGSESVPLPHNRVVFVMEDVDADSEVVRARDLPPVASGVNKGDNNAAATALIDLLAAAVCTSSDASSASDASGASSDAVMGPVNAIGHAKNDFNDRLNLAALLNVLDGVVDTPERIFVMTTNHPERLDPALVRPGRINRSIYLGRVKVAEATLMLRHYFDQLSAAQEVRLAEVFEDDVYSPAMLEAMCAEHDDVDALLAHIGHKEIGLVP